METKLLRTLKGFRKSKVNTELDNIMLDYTYVFEGGKASVVYVTKCAKFEEFIKGIKFIVSEFNSSEMYMGKSSELGVSLKKYAKEYYDRVLEGHSESIEHRKYYLECVEILEKEGITESEFSIILCCGLLLGIDNIEILSYNTKIKESSVFDYSFRDLLSTYTLLYSVYER